MDVVPTHEDRLRTNYSDIGVAVMQAMYSDDYLSIGGIESTNELAQLAGINGTMRVLDIGCGLGGPMLQLAESFGCSVTGIDLVQSSVDRARLRAAERGLQELSSFDQADATALPFDDGDFDVVWGQDAWCHVPDKTAMLAEANRVLRPGGTIAFTDWLAGDGMSFTEREAALDAALSTTAASADQYLALLSETGFVDVDYTDISQTFVRQYQNVWAGLHERRADLTTQFGNRVYEIVADINGTILRGFEGRAIGGGRFIASAG
jgi:ubiquinone/menaquinone biosynthesis C-methylase UbiE